MTRKDYEAFARAVSKMVFGSTNGTEIEASRECAELIADVCKADNPKFDRTRFLRACGLEKE